MEGVLVKEKAEQEDKHEKGRMMEYKRQIEELKSRHDLQLKAVNFEAEKTILELQCRLTERIRATSSDPKSPEGHQCRRCK